MVNTKPKEYEANHIYVLARAFCREGTVSGTRKQRLTCALLELRERIKEQFQQVSKTWHVSAEDLRRCYSYAYPASVPGAPDVLILERACEDLIRALRHEIQTHAEQFGVPDNLLEAMLVDWLVADEMGSQRTPSAFFIPDDLVAPTTAAGDAKPKDVLPSLRHLLAGRSRTAGHPPNLEEPNEPADERPMLTQLLVPETVELDGESKGAGGEEDR